MIAFIVILLITTHKHIKCDKFIQKVVFASAYFSLGAWLLYGSSYPTELIFTALLIWIDGNQAFEFLLYTFVCACFCCCCLSKSLIDGIWNKMGNDALMPPCWMETAGVNGLFECVNYNSQMWICMFFYALIADIVSYFFAHSPFSIITRWIMKTGGNYYHTSIIRRNEYTSQNNRHKQCHQNNIKINRIYQ